MYCSIKCNAMLSLRIVLAAFMGLLVLVCFAQPAAPQVSIEIIVIDGADHVKLSWEPVEGAESYNIYASPIVNPENWGDPLATVGDSVYTYTVEESVDELGRRYFFHVTAYAEVGIPDWLVLVDGDLFNGTVTIDPFYISKYQVTQEEWIEVMGNNPSHFADEDGVPHHENLPVERVSWFDVVEYCNRLSIREGLTPAYTYNGRSNPGDWYEQWPGWNTVDANHLNVSCDWEADGYRLPTEVEWQHAANAGIHPQPFTYSGSNDLNAVAWYIGNSDIGDGQGLRTHPVGTKAPNGLGIYDMSGNVWEWCWDVWGGVFPSGNDNPRGNGDHPTIRGFRGGGMDNNPDLCTVSIRGSYFVTVRGNIGFRVRRNVPPPPEEIMVLVDGDLFNGNVTIDPFYISKYQVTQEEWIEVMGNNPSHFADEDGVPHHENLPVERVSWFDVIEYCNRLSIREGLTPVYTYNGRTNPDDWYEQWPGWNTVNENHLNVSCDWLADRSDGYRLPTEVEWQHAANAGIHPQPFTYSGSNNVNEVAWYIGNSDIGDGQGLRTHPVGTKAPNGLGIYDMSGNVWEWCWDVWGGVFPSGNDNPRGNGEHPTMRGFRGGCFDNNPDLCTVSIRGSYFVTVRGNIGFRVARGIPIP